MTARRPTVVLAALVAGLVLALLAGLLLVAGLREGRGPDSLPAKPGPERPVRPKPPAPAPSAKAEQALPREPAAPVEDAPGTFRLPGSARLEDGSPLPGVHFLDMVRGDDGEPEVVMEPCPTVEVESGADGAFTLGWPARPSQVLLLVMSREAEVAAVANGALVGPHPHGTVVAATGEGPLALTMRWRPGAGLLRAKDAATGEVRTWWRKEGIFERRGSMFSMRWRLPDGGTEPVRGPAIPENPEGWIPFLPPGATPGPEDPGPGPIFEVVVEGYATARVPFEEMHGRVEVALQPLVPDLVGTVVVPGLADRQFVHGWSLVPDGGKDVPIPDLRGGIDKPGPFALSGVPDGRWILEVWAMTPAGVRWARRGFEKSGATVDLGTVEVSSWSGFRARAVDGEGRLLGLPIHAAGMNADSRNSVTLISGTQFHPSGESGLGMVVDDSGGSVRTFWIQFLPSAPGPDPEGWIEIHDLCPGERYRLATPSPPGAFVEEMAPAASGTLKTVEVKVLAPPVRCSLRFTVAGAAPAEWGEMWEGPAAPDPWRKDGSLEGPLYPGRHAVTIQARLEGKSGMGTFRAEFDIPERGPFEATIDLK